MCRVASKHALSVDSEALSQVLFSTAMGEEIDRKVQEAVDRALQELDERVSSVATKAFEKMAPKDKGRNDEQPPHSSFGGKQPSPLGVMSAGRSTLNFLLRPTSLPHVASTRDAINSYRRDRHLSWHIN